MAEGDTIVRTARRLEPVMTGRRVAAAIAPNPRSSLKVQVRKLNGRLVESIETRGKHLLIHFDGGLSLHSHLGMNGSWRVDDGRGFGRPDRLAWLLLETVSEASETGPATRVGQFGGTTLRLVRTVELDRDSRLARLGPDILAPGFSPGLASRRIRANEEEVGVALLNQTLVCGIGNIFKSEACFAAGIDPWRAAASLRGPDAGPGPPTGEASGDEAADLLAVVREQMLEAVETGRRPGQVYRKKGRPCPRCHRARILARGQGDDNRTTYWCPVCQT